MPEHLDAFAQVGWDLSAARLDVRMNAERKISEALYAWRLVDNARILERAASGDESALRQKELADAKEQYVIEASAAVEVLRALASVLLDTVQTVQALPLTLDSSTSTTKEDRS